MTGRVIENELNYDTNLVLGYEIMNPDLNYYFT